MGGNVVPECYFDTVLVTTILGYKRVNHQKGCNNVVKDISRGKFLKDDFAVGIVDKDKTELDYLKNECKKEVEVQNLILWKHETKPHYFIQLAPALEKWILAVAKESEINIEDFGLPKEVEKLKKHTKSELAGESGELKRLCKTLVSKNKETINTFSCWLKYLVENNRSADIKILKEQCQK